MSCSLVCPTANAPRVLRVVVFVFTDSLRAQQSFLQLSLETLDGVREFLGGFLVVCGSSGLTQAAVRDWKSWVLLLVAPSAAWDVDL